MSEDLCCGGTRPPTPPLPSLRALTRDLRSLHEAFAHPIAGGEYVALFLVEGVYRHMPRRVHSPDEWAVAAVSIRDQFVVLAEYGREYIPGSTKCSNCDGEGGWDESEGWLVCLTCDGSGHVATPFDAVGAARRLLSDAHRARTRAARSEQALPARGDLP